MHFTIDVWGSVCRDEMKSRHGWDHVQHKRNPWRLARVHKCLRP